VLTRSELNLLGLDHLRVVSLTTPEPPNTAASQDMKLQIPKPLLTRTSRDTKSPSTDLNRSILELSKTGYPSLNLKCKKNLPRPTQINNTVDTPNKVASKELVL
jgi:hypothetical protein